MQIIATAPTGKATKNPTNTPEMNENKSITPYQKDNNSILVEIKYL
jgi:hypothetical protein